ncbi:MAG TPA: CoA pyrophosphatase [Gammaproteobacteria bacterium]|nr:CoA pyrophosphatase [Gammaproteobacteria bacterium]
MDDYIRTLRAGLAGTEPPADPVEIDNPELPSDFIPPAGEPRLAAVLVPIVRHEPVPTVLFTRRTEHLPDHPGQVSFPGGSVERGDRDAIATALRETEEELSLPAERIETLGFLRPYRTTTGFIITPVVGLVEPGPIKPNPYEVAAAFETPLDFLLADSTFERREKEFDGRRVSYFLVNYEGEIIWGATAAILHEFCGLLR